MSSTAKGFHSLGWMAAPTGPPARLEARIAIPTFEHVYKRVPKKAQMLRTAVDVLRSPLRIYRKIRADETDDNQGYAYVGRPLAIATGEHSTITLPADSVFVVYLNHSLTVFDWCIERSDPSDPDAPEGPNSRFGELAWPQK